MDMCVADILRMNFADISDCYGYGLLADETSASYKLVLKTFLDAMWNKYLV